MKAIVLIDIPNKPDIENLLTPFNVNVNLDYGNETFYLDGEIKEFSTAKDVIMNTYDNLMICPHCEEIIGNTADWTPNYCCECGKPLSGGNGKPPLN